MSNQIVARFSKLFIIDDAQRTIEFHPVNVARKQLYQVYIPLADSKPLRIHMQINDRGRFLITDKFQVPAQVLELEAAFETAILQS